MIYVDDIVIEITKITITERVHTFFLNHYDNEMQACHCHLPLKMILGIVESTWVLKKTYGVVLDEFYLNIKNLIRQQERISLKILEIIYLYYSMLK